MTPEEIREAINKDLYIEFEKYLFNKKYDNTSQETANSIIKRVLNSYSEYLEPQKENINDKTI